MKQTKICTKCGIEKPLSEFSTHKKTKDGLRISCKKCSYIRHKKYRLKNKEKIREYHKEYNKKYYLKNKEKIKEREKKYCLKNKEKIKEKNKERYLKNIEAYKESRSKNKEKRKEYLLKNKDKFTKVNKKYRDSLCDAYIAGLLHIPVKECPTELIELKRAQIKLIRITKEVQTK